MKVHRPTLFDNRSRFLDRFGLLLVVTIASVVILMLVDIGPRVALAAGRWESALATLLVGMTLLLALRASGLRKRYQRVADVIVICVFRVGASLATVATVSEALPPPARASC